MDFHKYLQKVLKALKLTEAKRTIPKMTVTAPQAEEVWLKDPLFSLTKIKDPD